MIPSRIAYSVVFYILVMILIGLWKPSFMFEENKLKPFGVYKKQTVMSIGVISMGLAAFSFVLFTLLELQTYKY